VLIAGNSLSLINYKVKRKLKLECLKIIKIGQPAADPRRNFFFWAGSTTRA